MTQRLYYTEPYRKTFDATVIAVEVADGRTQVLLDQTAFYPTSGGQPFDTGTIGGAAVTDVVDRDDGAIAHVVSGTAFRPGQVIEGAIDWARRFDHMQQHTGQHVLSAAFDRLFGVRTESFHMGEWSATIDLAREVTSAEAARAEELANQVVWENRPVAIRFVSAEEAAAMSLRKEPARTGPLRLIDVEDFDLSACGGTHVERTGAIGIIAIGGHEKCRGGSRVEFLCGIRALERFRVWRASLEAMQQQLSVPPAEMAASIDRMQSEAKAQQRTLRGFQEQLAAHEAQSLLAGGRHVVGVLEGWDAQGIKTIATAATSAQPEAVVVLFTAATPAQVVIARGAKAGVDAGSLLKQLTAKFGGKGGGKPDLAQGGGLAADRTALVEAARALLNDRAEAS